MKIPYKIKFFNLLFAITVFGLFIRCSTQKISILSYNIRYANPNDGDNIWENRKGAMIESLRKIHPSAIGMQEVVHSQLIDLLNGMEEYSYVGVGREDGQKKGEYSPIFYQKKQLELLESDTFWLSDTPDQITVGWDAALERICTYARFKDKRSKEEFWLFNTHFDHVGEKARANSVRLIMSKIETKNQQQLPVILTGDFNLTKDHEPIQYLMSTFEDVQQHLNPEHKNYGTFTGFDTLSVEKRRIDYIFQKGFTVLEADHLWLKTEKGLWVSDHHPVKTVLIVKK